MIFFIFFFFYLFPLIKCKININELNICVWLSGSAYCEKDKYHSMKLNGPAKQFIHFENIYSEKTDTQGFIGIIENTKTIYVVLRGTYSLTNWLDDFEIKLVPYYLDGLDVLDGSKVHYGFYNSALNIANKTRESINKLRIIYPNFKIIITGHSYAASSGQLLALELIKFGIKNIEIINFGQPRVGNNKYAFFVNKYIKIIRITHERDIVPHLPLSFSDEQYIHSCGEIFETNNTLIECSKTICEDPKCSNQYSLTETNIIDHSYYLDHQLSCENSIIN